MIDWRKSSILLSCHEIYGGLRLALGFYQLTPGSWSLPLRGWRVIKSLGMQRRSGNFFWSDYRPFDLNETVVN